MILSDVSIFEALDQGEIEVEPFDKDNVQPSSIDIRIDNLFRVFRMTQHLLSIQNFLKKI